jgi:cytoskeletal protein RodZ
MVRQRRAEAAAQRAKEGRAPGWTPPAESSDSDSDSSDDGPKRGCEGKGPKKDKEVKEVVPDPNAKGGNAAKALSLAEAKKAEIAAKKKAAAEGEEAEGGGARGAGGGEMAVLKSMDIKKMNGDALKEHLKERGLGVQGQKKDLVKRLCDFEAAREEA